MKKEMRDIQSLHNWDKNPRTVSKDGIERLKKQITRLGQYKPLLITEDGTVLGGNMRLQAYKLLGLNDIWVSVVDADTEEKKIEYALSDNDRVGKYEGDQLSDLIGNFPDVEWNDYAVDLKEPDLVKDIMDRYSETVEDDVPEVSNEPAISKLGEVYQLGKHSLMCGDATDAGSVALLMNGQKADMVFTDPPYNVDYVGKNNDALKIKNDNMESDVFYTFLYDSFVNINAVMKSGGAIYICHADMERINFTKAFQDAQFKLSQVIIWAKDHFVMGRQDYQWQHEPLLYGWKEGGAHYFIDDHTQTTIWNIKRPSSSKEHPTMKPLALIEHALDNNTKGDDIVLDTFGGSGSTLIACEQTNRVCYMMELDPKYCDVIRKRYAKFIEKEDEWLEVTAMIPQ